MSVAVNTLARTTVLDAVGDTAGEDRGRESLAVVDPSVGETVSAKDSRPLCTEAPLRRNRRWRVPADIADDSPAVEPQADPARAEVKFRLAGEHTISFFASLAVHLVLLLSAALLTPAVNAPAETVVVVEAGLVEVARIEDQQEIVTLATPLAEAIDDVAAPDEPIVEGFTPIALDPGIAPEETPEVALVDLSDGAVGGLLNDLAGLAEGAGAGRSVSVAGKAGAGGGGVSADDAAGVDEGTQFFGVQGIGAKFVFVCDCSRSMSGLKWMELNRELSRCIGSLDSGKSFYVIFFDGQMHPMFEPFGREPGLLDATDENIEKARHWINNMPLGANTSPCDSVQFGAGLEPDVMYLLTDGEFSDYTAPYLRDFNKSRASKGKPKVVVHTIGFFSQKHQMVLERIAKDSGGTYQFVAGPKPVKQKRKSQNDYARPIGVPMFGGPVIPAGPVPQQGGD